MHWKHFLWILIPAALLAQPQGPPSPVDRGVFRILANGQSVGTERFEIEPAGAGYRTRAELKVKGPDGREAVESAVLNLTNTLEVISYTRLQKSPKKASVQLDFGGGSAKALIKVPEGESTREYYLDPKVVILDTNFFHHYALLPHFYDFKKGGAQHLNVFIPQESFPGMMSVEYMGKDEGMDKFLCKAELEILLWFNDAKKLTKLAVPAAKVEVVREVEKK